jgi:hypothetical protein
MWKLKHEEDMNMMKMKSACLILAMLASVALMGLPTQAEALTSIVCEPWMAGINGGPTVILMCKVISIESQNNENLSVGVAYTLRVPSTDSHQKEFLTTALTAASLNNYVLADVSLVDSNLVISALYAYSDLQMQQ